MTSQEPATGTEIGMYASRLVRRMRREVELPAGARILSILDEVGPLGISQLARLDQCSQPTMTGAVNSLVERGWVTKEPDPADARATLVTMTADGVEALAESRRALGAFLAQVLAASGRHDPEDARTTAAVLRALVETPLNI